MKYLETFKFYDDHVIIYLNLAFLKKDINIIFLRNSLFDLGVSIKELSYIFGEFSINKYIPSLLSCRISKSKIKLYAEISGYKTDNVIYLTDNENIKDFKETILFIKDKNCDERAIKLSLI